MCSLRRCRSTHDEVGVYRRFWKSGEGLTSYSAAVYSVFVLHSSQTKETESPSPLPGARSGIPLLIEDLVRRRCNQRKNSESRRKESSATIAGGRPKIIAMTTDTTATAIPAIAPPPIASLLRSPGAFVGAAVVVGGAVVDEVGVEDPNAVSQSTVNWLMLVLE